MSILYISPTGAGDRSGSSAANAATLPNLNKVMYDAGPGGEVRLLADQGSYTLSADLQIWSSGVTVRGVNAAGEPMQATISSPMASIFILRDGANGLTFKDLMLKDTTGGYGALRIGADVRDLTVDNVDAMNVRTFLAVGPSPNKTASIDGLVVRNVEVTGYTSGAIKLAGASSDIVLEDIVLDGQNKDPSSFMVGVQMYDTAHDIVIRRVTASNNIYTGSGYYNGDGFVAEGGVYNLRFEDTVARNNGDAGYDIKASSVVLENALAEGNKRNFRFWGDGATANNITGLNPQPHGDGSLRAQVWLGANAHATISNSTFTDSNPETVVFELDDGAFLTLVNSTVNKNPSAGMEYLAPNSRIDRVTAGAPLSPTSSGAPLIGGEAADHLQGLSSTDELRGEGGDDYIRGADGDDRLYGGAGFDDVHGNVGNDTAEGGLGADWVVGGQGSDLLLGQEDGDIVLGNIGADTCIGGVADDVVRGGRDNDSVSGGDGADFVSGDRGDDTVSGGDGADLFNFFAGAGVDRVVDFSFAQGDRVRIEGAAYSVHSSGADTVVDLGGGDQMVLVGVSLSALPEGWLVVV